MASPPGTATMSMAYLTLVKLTTAEDGRVVETVIGSIKIFLHSDLVPLGVQNFAALLHRSIGGYRGTSARLCGSKMAELGDISESGDDGHSYFSSCRDEPRWRQAANQHRFDQKKRGLVGLIDVATGGSKFFITLDDAAEFDQASLVFGVVDLFDPSSLQALEALETELKIGSVVRISQCGLHSFQFKDLLDVSRDRGVPNDIDWNAIHSRLGLLREHPSYAVNARWAVGDNCEERNILHGLIYHEAPVYIVSDALSLISENDMVTPDPALPDWRGGYYPLTVAYEFSMDRAIIQLLVEKVDACSKKIRQEAYSNVLDQVALPRLGLNDLRMILDCCEREIAVKALEMAINGWRYVRTENDRRVLAWEQYDSPGGVDDVVRVESQNDLKGIWDNICLLLYAIERGSVKDFDVDATPFSPLGTLFSLGTMKQWGNRPALSLDDDNDSFLDLSYSVKLLTEYVCDNFPHFLRLKDDTGRLPLHHAGLAYCDYSEENEGRQSELLWRIGNIEGFELAELAELNDRDYFVGPGDRTLIHILEQDPEAALEVDKSGNTVLHYMLSGARRPPVVRIQLALQTIPKLALVKGSTGRLPFEDAQHSQENSHHGDVMEQMYINHCFLWAHKECGQPLKFGCRELIDLLYEGLSSRDSVDAVASPMINHFIRLFQAGTSHERDCSPLTLNLIVNRIIRLCGLDLAFDGGVNDELEYSLEDLVKRLLGQRSIEELDDFGRSPLHFLIENAFVTGRGDAWAWGNVIPRILLKHLVNLRPQDASVPCRGDTPVLLFARHAIPYYTIHILEEQENRHIVDIKGEVEEYLTLLLEKYPEALNECDEDGRPLLFAALEHGSDVDGIAKAIIRDHPNTAILPFEGRLPIHVALEKGCGVLAQDIAAASFGLDFDSTIQRDPRSRLYPFQIAACSEKCSLDDVYFYLRQGPHLVVGGLETFELL